ncbi:hypothetical protein BST81_11545 [Leptolyngbya sp. 'hensonii']|uniref:DUF2949 domain-containing protein n=1 Tax=Leptolyngbya sp. 'hensonii' TaxID=1922337 RepID=UPI00094FAB14|nr:DUF2949 domain-containing protein [Leptolyngbya sp. 'hensonii']OLP18292.1 hypothetical protein BST81_11545 [Leptolyngbya sp. 'hensonii']
MPIESQQSRLIEFLREELAISDAALSFVLEHPEQESYLPMILWQYGFVSLEQLEQIFEWKDSNLSIGKFCSSSHPSHPLNF